MRSLRVLALLALITAACTATKTDAPKPSADTSTPVARATAKITPGGTISGTIREVIPVESYRYLRLDTPNGELWTAVNEAKLAVGDTLTVYNVFPMEQFKSPTLKRTFAVIYFGSTEPVAPAPAATESAQSTTGSSTAPDARVGIVAPATGSGANTILALWASKDRLAKTTIAVRGVVVKYNADVMGKNWIHLQDGSGDPARGTHDIAATTLETAAVGDTVTLMGVLRTNVDVGAGYKYALLIENARVVAR